MSYLTDINCSTILEAIKTEKLKHKNSESEVEGDFVNVTLHVNTFWTDLFANCFLCTDHDNKEGAKSVILNTLTHDDMLFFVSRIATDENKIEVYRRDSKRLPCLTDLNYDWEETVYLNLVLHEFEYTLTCAICAHNGDKNLDILKRHSKRVFASPSKRDLSSKGTEEIMTYPNIYFIIDDFDEAFNEMIVRENEMVCVELVANDGRIRKVLFLGSIKYESLKKVYDARASTTEKVVQKISLGYNTLSEKRVEFVKMKGPGGKGYAEMAVSKYQSKPETSAPNTPTEPQSYFDPFNNFLKFSNPIKKRSSTTLSQVGSIVSSPIDSLPSSSSNLVRTDSSSGSLWNKTFNQAITWFKPSEVSSQSSNNNQYFPLNAYLTYVTLKLPLIMHDVLETRNKSLLTI